jgi:hypothetical protein
MRKYCQVKMNTLAIVLILAIIIGICVALVINKKPPKPPKPSQLGRLANPLEFYTLTSSDGLTGRNVDGDLMKNGVLAEHGFSTKEDLGAHLLTYAHGHEFYKSGSSGQLTGGNWKEHASGFAPSLSKNGPLIARDQVLVFEDGATACLDGDACYLGLVVQKGATVLVSGNVTLRVQFLLIESGGLFQAGSSYKNSHRFNGNFKLILIHPDEGYEGMGCPASQYSYQVYAPGVVVPKDTTATSLFLAYNGSAGGFGNGYGPKSICVGFNGNYHLAGAIAPAIPYSGTWNAWASDNTPVFSKEDRLSIGVEWLPSEYPAMWLAIAPGEYPQGTDRINVTLPEGAPDGTLNFWIGKEVLVLACPRQFTTCSSSGGNDNTGMLPLWINDSDAKQAQANDAANQAFLGRRPKTVSASIGGQKQSVPGIEVMTVTSVLNGRSLIFKDKFRFDHSAKQTSLTRKSSSSISVDTVPHVCLLSRNILVTSELREGKGGCNVTAEQAGLNAMAPGKMARSMQEMMGASSLEETKTQVLAAGKLRGPGGSVMCNNAGLGQSGGLEIFKRCYKASSQADLFCGKETPKDPETILGHWLWGTDGMKGCGTIHGGQHFFRNGSAVNIDGVEIKRLGTPANFGSIAQYSLHFHCTGYAKSFRDYLPSRDYPRELRVANSSIWLSLSRWITLHGTSEADISNNIGFVCFGSGYFVEDGTEIANIFDHNVGAYAVPGVQSDYLNSTPIYPNVATDFGQMSVFWLKNNHNILARNVACCSPGATIGFWMVPQQISQLRGISTLCIGSEPLGLPGFGSALNATGNNPLGGLSPFNNNNADGKLPSVSGKTATPTSCWVPDNFEFPLLRVKDKCISFTDLNSDIPWFGFMENINYCTFMLIGEMPEMLLDSSLRYDMSPGIGIGIGAQIQDNVSRAQWMAFNGQTACTDYAIGTYSETRWLDDLSYQASGINLVETDKDTESEIYKSRTIPKILSGVLSFCTGPFRGLWGGTGWTKQMAVWTLNCAYINTAEEGDSQKLAIAIGENTICEDPDSSTIFVQTVMANERTFNKMYAVFHNFICNGRVSLPPSPCLWSGAKTFLDDKVIFFGNGEEGLNGNTAVQKHFCDFDTLKVSDIFSNPLKIGSNLGGVSNLPIEIYLFDVKFSTLNKIEWSSGNWSVSPQQAYPGGGGGRTKFPFVCDGSALRRDASSEFLKKFKLGDAVANLVTAQFYTKGGLELGDAICAGLYKIPSDLEARGWPS